MAVMPGAQAARLGRHIHLLAVLWMAVSAINLIGGAAVLIVGNTLFGRMMRIHDGWPMQGFLQGLLTVIGLLILLKAFLGFAAGWGLLQHEPWARTLTLVLGFIGLLNVPFGTALGVYTIWVLLSPDADQEYRRLSRAA